MTRIFLSTGGTITTVSTLQEVMDRINNSANPIIKFQNEYGKETYTNKNFITGFEENIPRTITNKTYKTTSDFGEEDFSQFGVNKKF